MLRNLAHVCDIVSFPTSLVRMNPRIDIDLSSTLDAYDETIGKTFHMSESTWSDNSEGSHSIDSRYLRTSDEELLPVVSTPNCSVYIIALSKCSVGLFVFLS